MAEIVVLDAVIMIAPPEEPWPKQLAAKIELLARRRFEMENEKETDLETS